MLATTELALKTAAEDASRLFHELTELVKVARGWFDKAIADDEAKQKQRAENLRAGHR